MTEEIIYNKCCCYENGFCLWVKKYYETGITPKCRQVKDCYYKQLIRLKQQHNDDTEEIAKLGLDVAILEQENKELKEQNETLNYQWHKQSEIGDEWYKVAEKYKTALEEIQKAIKSYDLGVDNGVSVDTLYTIRKIINEVLE